MCGHGCDDLVFVCWFMPQVSLKIIVVTFLLIVFPKESIYSFFFYFMYIKSYKLAVLK